MCDQDELLQGRDGEKRLSVLIHCLENKKA